MNIELSEYETEFLNELVAEGKYPSAEEAVHQILGQRMFENDDLMWAKPLVDEALANLENGAPTYTLEEIEAETREHLNQLRNASPHG